MGLDSVEIVVRIEEYFGISIPDAEAAQISTVQGLVDAVFSKVSVHPNARCKSQMLFYKLKNFFLDNYNLGKNEIMPEAKIADLMTQNLAKTWEDLQRHLKVNLPALTDLDLHSAKATGINIWGMKMGRGKSSVTVTTIGELIDWILARNYKALIDPNNLFNKRDIENVVVGIVSDSVGISVNEIKLRHSLTGDLGMD